VISLENFCRDGLRASATVAQTSRSKAKGDFRNIKGISIV
jgi:hypothetical protein